MNTESHCDELDSFTVNKPISGPQVVFKCSGHPNLPPKRFIAMLADVAAFGLRGSSQKIGTVVK